LRLKSQANMGAIVSPLGFNMQITVNSRYSVLVDKGQ
jgi:hypothetical protein